MHTSPYRGAVTSDDAFREILAIVGDQMLVDQVLPDGWSARYYFAVDGTSLRLARIEITRGSEAGPISTAALRGLRPTAAERTARRLARANPAVLRQVDVLQGTERWAPIAQPPGGRATMDDLQLAGVALEYVRAIDMGERAPAARIAALAGVRSIQARGYIRRARARGLLTEAAHGRSGGELTPKAIAILEPMIEDLRSLAADLTTNQEED